MPFYTYRCNTCGLEKDFLKSTGQNISEHNFTQTIKDNKMINLNLF